MLIPLPSFLTIRSCLFQHDRARVLYKYALQVLPKDKTHQVYKAYTIHEKKYGDRSGNEIQFSLSHSLLFKSKVKMFQQVEI